MRSRSFTLTLTILVLALFAVPASSALASPDPAPDAMPAYCTNADVEGAYGTPQLAEVTGDPTRTTVNQDKLTKAVGDYGAEIATHARRQRADAFEGSDNALLKNLNVEGAFLMLKKRSRGGLGEDDRKQLERLDRMLADIGGGKILLEAEGDAPPGDVGDFGDTEALFSGRTRRFSVRS